MKLVAVTGGKPDWPKKVAVNSHCMRRRHEAGTKLRLGQGQKQAREITDTSNCGGDYASPSSTRIHFYGRTCESLAAILQAQASKHRPVAIEANLHGPSGGVCDSQMARRRNELAKTAGKGRTTARSTSSK
jgi:hypothetical protein